MSTETDSLSHIAEPARFAKAAADLLFPSRCLACSVRPVEAFRAGGVCASCWAALPALTAPRCAACDDPLPAVGADACGRCGLDPPPFARLRGAAPYRGSARALLIAFKFRGADFLAAHLARHMIRTIAGEHDFVEVVPVPATPFSRLRRDHPADQLARAVADLLPAPFAPGRLRKIRATERQSGLPARRRAPNVRGAFVARPGAPDRVLLVDDVATSGATARECAKALARAGAREVDVWCSARASRDDEIEGIRRAAESTKELLGLIESKD